MMNKKIGFEAEHREQIATALSENLGIKNEDTQNRFIDAIEQSGMIRGFGFGSLLTYSHFQNADNSFKPELTENFPDIDTEGLIKVKPATLYGYERDFVCYDTHYRGTPEEPGITLGLDQMDDAKTPGGVLETDVSSMSPAMAAAFTQFYLESFAEREMPPNMPIYTFDFLDVDITNRGQVPALVCVADNEGPLYIHNENNDFAKQDPDYYIERGDASAKATILATAHGGDNAPGAGIPGKMTDLDYLRGVIDSSFEKNIPVEPRFHDLYTRAIIERASMDPDDRDFLESMELDGDASNKINLLEEFTRKVEAHNAALFASMDHDVDGLDEYTHH
ncbi:MAG: gamma-glutamylcyclotransferase [Alcanivorax sp.]